MADLDSHLVEADPDSGWGRVVKDVTAGTCGGIGKYREVVLRFFKH